MKDLINDSDLISIAKFMGFTFKDDIGWYDNEMQLPEIVYDVQGSNCFDTLLFNQSWDWLMPCVAEVFNVIAPLLDGTNNENENAIGNISHAVLDVNINDTYNFVVIAIKWYNEQK